MGQRNGDSVFYRDLHRTYPELVRGEGVYLYGRDGRRFIDGSGGAMVCSLGHGNREVAEHLREQAERLAFVPIARFTHEPQIELAERLALVGSPALPYSYFVSGGSEAVESAVKMARQYHLERGEGSRYLVVSRRPSYHGNTIGCLAVGGHPGRRRNYEPYLMPSPKIGLPNCSACPWGLERPSCALRCARAIEEEILNAGPRNVSCFLFETITGSCGGVIVPPEGYLQRVAEICRRHGVLMIADEVMCGAGRTGRFLAASHFDFTPDILILGKGITAGYAPLAALLVSSGVYEVFEKGSGAFVNNFTYAANPVSCAAACKVLEIVERDGLVARAATVGVQLRSRLAERMARIRVAGDVRGVGMMIAVDLWKDRQTRTPFPASEGCAEKLARACLDEGLVIYAGLLALVEGSGDCFLLGPPFTITDHEIDELLDALDRGLRRAFPDAGAVSG